MRRAFQFASNCLLLFVACDGGGMLPDRQKRVRLHVDERSFDLGAPVRFQLINGLDSSIVFPRSPAWTIRDASNDSLMAPFIYGIVLDELRTGGAVEYAWNQRNAYGDQVEPGTYAVSVSFWNSVDFDSLEVVSKTFRIDDRTGRSFN